MDKLEHPAGSKYRADIDGLRALAVTSVVVFHLVHSLLPQGFLGVDIFFVISGYLITSIIWKEAKEQRFSILEFYERRVRRIIPALLVLLMVISFASVALLLPADLIGYGKSVLASLSFVANIYFWRDTDYFARAAAEKPLLNLWSLSVEEQFYIFFPLLIMFLVRWPRSVLPLLCLLTFGSLVSNVGLIYFGGKAPAFYLLPSRAWELGVGALVALLAPAKLHGIQASVLRIVALILMIGGLFWKGHWQYIPESLPVIIGAAVFIWIGAPTDTLSGRILSFPPVNFVGKVSYSLYLWHWPVIVLVKYYLIRDLTYLEALLVGLASICLASISWKYVEKPFRASSMPFKRVGWSSLALAAVIACLAATLILRDGLPNRLNFEASEINRSVGTHYRCPISLMKAFGASRACDINLGEHSLSNAEVVLLGNSHAQMYTPLIRNILNEYGKLGIMVPLNACFPLVSVNISKYCLDAAQVNLDAILELPHVQTVIIAFNWPLNVPLFDAEGNSVNLTHDKAMVDGVLDLVQRLKGRRVVVVGPIAQPGFDIASMLSRQIAFDKFDRVPSTVPVGPFRKDYAAVWEILGANLGVTLIRPDLQQCDDIKCDFVRNNLSIFSDEGHVSERALYIFRNAFDEIFRERAGPINSDRSISDKSA